MSSASAATNEILVTGYHDVKQAYRFKNLRQAMYDDGAVVMADCLLDLHGAAHSDRRRLENRLFRRDVFAHWEREVLGATIDQTLRPFVAQGKADLTVVGYRAAMNMTALIAGIDHDPSDAPATEALYATVKKLSEGATLVHSTRNKAEVVAEVREVMAEFHEQQYLPSLRRRQALVAEVQAGHADAESLPRDVLTTLVANVERLNLEPDVTFREVCFYLQAGAHSTANAFVHSVHDLFQWGQTHPNELATAAQDIAFTQRCVHESLRLHPASPVAWRTALAPVTFDNGTNAAEGTKLVLDLAAANRDPSVFGGDADSYNPHRRLDPAIPPWGHTFGGGRHACIGAELDGGVAQEDGQLDDHLFGTVAVITHAFLGLGGRPDPQNPPVVDPTTERLNFASYPVVFS